MERVFTFSLVEVLAFYVVHLDFELALKNMMMFKNRARSLLMILLEAAAIHRRPESKIPYLGFHIFQALCWFSFCAMITNCAIYLVIGDGNKMMTVAMISMTAQCLMYNVILSKRGEEINALIDASDRVLSQIDLGELTLKELESADRKSDRFTKGFIALIFMNIITAVAQAAVKVLQTGRPSYPFEQGCLGLSMGPCWALQVTTATHVVFFIAMYFSIMKIIIYQLSAYTAILSKYFETRSPSNDEVEDRKLFKLYCDVTDVATSFTNIFGVTAFIELCFVAVRNSFQSYHVLMSINRNEWVAASQSMMGFLSSNLFPYLVCACGEDLVETTESLRKGILMSKWYRCPPPGRKRLVPVLMFVQEPIRFHYRQVVFFNMESFAQVVRTTYSLITALANFM